jgi:hypothetical protein
VKEDVLELRSMLDHERELREVDELTADARKRVVGSGRERRDEWNLEL